MTNLRVKVYPKNKKAENSALEIEKTLESDSKLRIKFVPIESVEHIIDIIDNNVSIEGFPQDLTVYPNKELFFVTENINGVKIGNHAKFKLYLNSQKYNNVNIKITSKILC